MKLGELIVSEALVPELQSSERDDAIKELIDALVDSGAVDQSLRDELVKKVLDREKRGSTGFGKGVAVPHVKHDKLPRMLATVGVSAKGVDFSALDKQPVYSIIMLLSPTDKPDQHLQAMEAIFGHLQQDTFRKFLRQATTREDILDLIQEADGQQLQV